MPEYKTSDGVVIERDGVYQAEGGVFKVLGFIDTPLTFAPISGHYVGKSSPEVLLPEDLTSLPAEEEVIDMGERWCCVYETAAQLSAKGGE